MKWYLDWIFREINEKLTECDYELEGVEDEFGLARRYAQQGARIKQERWHSIFEKQRKIDNKIYVFKLLKSTLYKYYSPFNSDKEKTFYRKIINEEILEKLAKTENFEGCALVEQFMEKFEAEKK